MNIGSLLKAIPDNPFILLGICLAVIGAASLVFKVFNALATGNKSNNGESKIQRKALVFILIAILIVLIVFIYWLRNMK